MDPEEFYQEVLKEEQQKGSAPAVAEGRAKAARVRAEQGSPHPKEAKWWPGAQPHLEGGDAGEAEAAPAEAEEAPAEAPAAEEAAPEPAPAPAVEAQPEQPAVTAAQAEADATPQTTAPPPDAGIETAAPAAAASDTAPAAVAVAPEQPVTVTQLAPEARPAGVRSGTTSGGRLRPEDGVSTEAQFEGQAAMYERRKVIDELIATGVPAAAVRREDDRGSPMLAFLYLIIPIVALVVVANLNIAGGDEGGGEEGGGGGGGGGGISISAANVQFDTDTLELPAGEETTITFTNEDTAEHNVAIYEDSSAESDLFKGQIISGGDSTDYQVGPIEAGTYYFQCDVHPSMNGDVEVS
jgi:plastocyanin